MTFFGKQKSFSLFDQQAYHRNNEQKVKRRRNFASNLVRLGIVVVTLVVFVAIAVRVPSLYTKVTKPFKSINSEFYKGNSLNFERRTNILLATVREDKLEELALASFESGKKKVIILKLDPSTLVNGQKGPKKLSDLVIYQAGKVSDIDQLSVAVLEVVNYIPNGYVIVEASQDWINIESLGSLVERSSFSPALLLNLRENKNYLDGHLLTSLSTNEFYKLVTSVKKIQPERFELVDTERYKSQSGFVDSKALTNEIGAKMNDSKVVDGNYAVEIVNSSGVEGLGQILKSVVANLGVNIVQISTTEDLEEKSTVFVRERSNFLAETLQRFLKSKLEKNADTGSVDIKIVIGKDFGKFFDY